MDTKKRKEKKNKMYKLLKEMRTQKNITALEMANLLGLKTASAYYKREWDYKFFYCRGKYYCRFF